MSDRFAERFAAKPEWLQGMMVVPDLVCVDYRVWISTNRGFWSTASQVTEGLDATLVHLAVGAELPWSTPGHVSVAAGAQIERLITQYTEPFPPRPAA